MSSFQPYSATSGGWGIPIEFQTHTYIILPLKENGRENPHTFTYIHLYIHAKAYKINMYDNVF